jgi:hypothetical protein
MYGYEPPSPTKAGGCRDTLILIRVAFEVLTPIAAAGLGALAYVALTFWLFSAVGALAGAVPIALAGAGIAWVARRDRRIQREREREARGE